MITLLCTRVGQAFNLMHTNITQDVDSTLSEDGAGVRSTGRLLINGFTFFSNALKAIYE